MMDVGRDEPDNPEDARLEFSPSQLQSLERLANLAPSTSLAFSPCRTMNEAEELSRSKDIVSMIYT